MTQSAGLPAANATGARAEGRRALVNCIVDVLVQSCYDIRPIGSANFEVRITTKRSGSSQKK